METVRIPNHYGEYQEATVLSRTDHMRIGVEPKERWITRITNPDGSQDDIPIIAKCPTNLSSRDYFDDPTLTASQIYIKTWERAREAGLPVVPWVSPINVRVVALPDLCASGDNIYSASDIISIKKANGIWDNPSITDTLFASIDEANLHDSLEALANLATEKKIGLPFYEASHILMKKDGSFSPFVLDVGEIELQLVDIEKHNYDAISRVTGGFIALQKFFKEIL